MLITIKRLENLSRCHFHGSVSEASVSTVNFEALQHRAVLTNAGVVYVTIPIDRLGFDFDLGLLHFRKSERSDSRKMIFERDPGDVTDRGNSRRFGVQSDAACVGCRAHCECFGSTFHLF